MNCIQETFGPVQCGASIEKRSNFQRRACGGFRELGISTSESRKFCLMRPTSRVVVSESDSERGLGPVDLHAQSLKFLLTIPKVIHLIGCDFGGDLGLKFDRGMAYC
jgi:hypothetical protein